MEAKWAKENLPNQTQLGKTTSTIFRGGKKYIIAIFWNVLN